MANPLLGLIGPVHTTEISEGLALAGQTDNFTKGIKS